MVSALSLGADHLTLAVINSPITLSFGMIGLAAGQTLRLNAINIVRTPASVAIAQVPCRVELELFDAQGNILKQSVADISAMGSRHSSKRSAIRRDTSK